MLCSFILTPSLIAPVIKKAFSMLLQERLKPTLPAELEALYQISYYDLLLLLYEAFQ